MYFAYTWGPVKGCIDRMVNLMLGPNPIGIRFWGHSMHDVSIDFEPLRFLVSGPYYGVSLLPIEKFSNG